MGVLNANLDLVKTDLLDDKSKAEIAKSNWQSTIDYHNKRKEDLIPEIQSKKNLMTKLKKEGGF